MHAKIPKTLVNSHKNWTSDNQNSQITGVQISDTINIRTSKVTHYIALEQHQPIETDLYLMFSSYNNLLHG